MATSIFHRITGNAMAFGAVVIFAWWLIAAASGEEAYATWHSVATGPLGWLVGIGFTWVFFQHMMSGVRHLLMDTGANFEITRNRTSAWVVFIAAAVLTALTWIFIVGTKL
jgi:succinate dehydrogenase / fumarate reductase cytochrome b subunit